MKKETVIEFTLIGFTMSNLFSVILFMRYYELFFLPFISFSGTLIFGLWYLKLIPNSTELIPQHNLRSGSR